ncbi:MAG: preprotein translocase subunit SecE [Alphaproteobacteria bacterium]|nr:MAG: preprotein translocase subunit SecE [Alphaproteobacteria bacterium]
MAIEAKAKAIKAAPAPAKPRVSIGTFVNQVKAEIAKVSWPSRADTIRMTIMVMIMTTILSVFFLGVDQVLGRLVKFLLSLAG